MRNFFKKAVSVMLSVAMLTALLPKLNFSANAEDCNIPESIGEDDISYDETTKTYNVKTAKGLYWIDLVNHGYVDDDTYNNDPDVNDFQNSYQHRYIVLCNDIDMSGIDWETLDSLDFEFNGAGHKILNLNIISCNQSYSFADYATYPIENLSISGTIKVSDTFSQVSGIVNNGFKIINCITDMNITAEDVSTCCISGISNYSEKIENSISLGTITCDDYTANDVASISYSNESLTGDSSATKTIVTNCYAKQGSCDNVFGFDDSDSIDSCGTFDDSGNITAVSNSTLSYGSDLKTAMSTYINRCGPDSDKYVKWTDEKIPSLTTTYGTPFDYDYGDYVLGSDGRYSRTDSITGHVDYASITLENGDNVTPFSDIEEAINAAQSTDGGVLTLLSDVNSKDCVKIESGKFTIDLEGQTWESTYQNDDNPCIAITGGDVTFKGTDSAKIMGSSKNSLISIKSSYVDFQGGTYKNYDEGYVVLADSIKDDNSVKITDGEFENYEDENMCMVFKDCNYALISGGAFDSIKVDNKENDCSITTVGDLLADGLAYYDNYGYIKLNDNVTSLDDVWVDDAPFKIKSQPQDTNIEVLSQVTLSVDLERSGYYKNSDVTYQWYKDGNIITDATSEAFTENDLPLGEYNYYCIITCEGTTGCDGYSKQTNTATVTVSKKSTYIENKDYATTYTYNGSSIPEPTADDFESNRSDDLTFTWYKGDSTAESDKLQSAPKEVGNYTLKVSTEGTDDYNESSATFPIEINYLVSDAVAALDSPKPSNGWYKGVDVVAPTGFKIATADSPSNWKEKIEINYSMNGDFDYYLKEDSTGCLTDKKTISIKNDSIAPTFGTISYSEHQTFLDWIFNKETIDISVPVSDDCSGVYDSIMYSYSGAGYFADFIDGEAKFSISSDFVGEITIACLDNAGNYSCVTTTKMMVENNAPTLSVLDGTDEFSETTTYTSDKTLDINVADAESGIKSLSYTVDNGDEKTLFDTTDEKELKMSLEDNSVNVLEGSHTYKITAVDNALNVTTKEISIKKDTTPPTLSYFSGSNITDTTAGYNFTADEWGTYYYVLQKKSDPELTVDDVLTNCSTPISFASSLNSGTFNNLLPNTRYCCYFVAKDNFGNTSTSVYEFNFQTSKTSLDKATMSFDNSDFTYNSNEQKPNTTLTASGRTLVEGTDYTLSYSNSNGGDDNISNAGTVSVTANGINDCKGSVTKTYEIKKAEVTPTILGTTSKVYDGTTSTTGGLSIDLSGVISGDSVNATADFSLEDKNVGQNKSVVATNITLDNENYTLKDTTATSNCAEVTQKIVNAIISGDTTYVYNGLANFNNDVSYETVSGDEVNATVLYNGSEIKPTDVGTYELTSKINDSNYKLNETTGINQLTINKANVSLGLSSNNSNPTYGDSVIFTATVDKDNIFNTVLTNLSGKVSFYLDDELVDEKDVDSFNRSVNLTLDKSKLTAGDHKVFAVYSGNDNLNQSYSADVSTSISKRTLDKATMSFDSSDFIYNSNEQKPNITLKVDDETLVEGTDYTLSYSNSNGGDNNITNAGSVSVTANGINDFEGSVTKTYEIEKAEVTPTISGTTSKVYDGTTEVFDGVWVSLSDVMENDSVNATADISLENKNVGQNKTVVATNITIDNDNYTLKDTTATSNCAEVTPKTVDATISGDTTYVYNRFANFNNDVSYETVSGDEVNATVLYNGSEIKPTDVGTYELTAKINDPNYKLNETTGINQLTINKANASLGLSSNNSNPTYGDSIIFTATVDKDNIFNSALTNLSGKVSFYLDDELVSENDVDNFNKSANLTLDKSKLTAGDHKVFVVYSGNDNLNQSYSAEVSTSISKRTLDFDTSNLSVATKKYDGTRKATVNGTLYVSNVLEGDDVGFSYSSLVGEFETATAGTQSVELSVVDGKVTNPNYQLSTDVPKLEGTINKVIEIDVPESTDESTYQLEVEEGFSEIPDTLMSNEDLNTEDKIKAMLKLTVEKTMSGVDKDNISVFDLTLKISNDGGATWQVVDDENFPKDGITVILPYPEGTNKDDYDFTVTHMFTTDDKAGTTENITPTKTDEGLEFKLYSLSPVAVGYEKIVNDETPTNTTTTETNNDTSSEDTSNENTTNPKTGVFGGILPIAFVSLAFGGSYCVLKKKKRNK